MEDMGATNTGGVPASLLEALVPALPFLMLAAGFLLGWAVKGLLARLWRDKLTVAAPAPRSPETRPAAEPAQVPARITRQEKREMVGLLDKIPHFLHQFLEAEETDQIAKGLCAAFCHLFSLDEAGVWLREKDAWVLAARKGLGACPAEARTPLKAGKIGHVAQAAKPLLREDFDRTSGLERARIQETQEAWDDFDLYVPLGTRSGVAEGVVVCQAQTRGQLASAAPLANILGALGALTLRNLEQRRRFRELAELDFLTGLPSRMAFFKRLESLLDPARELDFFFLLLDLDHFKEINDRMGHQVGDFTLKSFARVLRDEIEEFEYAGRLGGE